MIPIVSLSDLINGLIAAVIAAKVFNSYKKTSDQTIFDFFLFYVFITFFWLALATPQIFITDPFKMVIASTAAYIFLFMALAIMTRISFLFISWRTAGRMATIIIFIGTIAFVIGRLSSLAPHQPEYFPPFIYWRPVMAPWLRILTGIMTTGSALISSSIFFYFGYKDRSNAQIFHRSILLGSGLLILLVGAVMAFLVNPNAGFAANCLASLASIPGMVVMLYGINYKSKATASQVIS